MVGELANVFGIEQMSKQIKALTFDVFGTLTNWRGTIIREGEELSRELEIEVDWGKFADAWRTGYHQTIRRINERELPWQNIDTLHRGILNRLLEAFEIPLVDEARIDALNRVWHRLELWPDVREGIQRLRQSYVVAPFSNGNVSLLVNLSKRSGLDWDCVLSAELFQRYKPDPGAYTSAAALLGFKPEEVLMVASHNSDLDGARATGFATAFVCRPTEHGPDQSIDLVANPEVDFSCDDLSMLADQLSV